MQELLLINPRKRATRRKSTKAASPAQKRARAAFAAASRARAGKKRTAKRRSHAPAVTLMSNPRKRRTHRSHAAKRHSRRHSNPIAGHSLLKKPLALLTPALMGALGATAVNTILGKLPIPAAAMTGKMRYVTQGAAAIALAMIASKLGVKGAMAAQMAEGSLTVTLHQAIVDISAGMGMNLSGMGYYLPGVGARAVPSPSANSAPMAMAGGVGKYLTGPGATRGMQMRGMSAITRGRGGFGF